MGEMFCIFIFFVIQTCAKINSDTAIIFSYAGIYIFSDTGVSYLEFSSTSIFHFLSFESWPVL